MDSNTSGEIANNQDAPIYDAWLLQKAELSGTKESQWAAQLASAADTETAAAVAYTVASRLSIRAPSQLSVSEIRQFIEANMPIGMIHTITLDRIINRIETALKYRKQTALAEVRPSAERLANHNVEIVGKLPELADSDYTGIIVLWSPMASGKTSTVGKPFSKYAQNAGKVVAICHRVSLVNAMSSVLGLHHYSDIDAETVWLADGLATCLPSIIKSDHAPIIDRAGFVFIDEIAQVLRFLETKSHCRTREGDNQKIYDKLCHIVKAAKCVIVADAGIDDRTLAFLEQCRPEERFRIIQMKPKSDGISASWHTGGDAPEKVVGECLAELLIGGKVWLSVESSDRAEQLGRFFTERGFKTLAINADTKYTKAQKAFLQNIDGESRNYDVVIASPVIGSGVSIEHRGSGHFTLGAFIGGGHRITPADAAQMLRRVRYLRRYALGILPNTAIGQQSPEAILIAQQQAATLENRFFKVSSFDELIADIRASYDNHRADFANGLYWQLEKAGWTLHRPDAEIYDGITAELAALKSQHGEAYRTRLKAASALSEIEAAKIERNVERTIEQAFALKAHNIRQSLGVEALDDEVIDFYEAGGISKTNRFRAFHSPDASALSVAYQRLFDGIDLYGPIDESVSQIIVDRVVADRFLYAHLGVVSSAYGKWQVDRKGSLLPYKQPKNPNQEMANILGRMGMQWQRKQSRKCHTLGNLLLSNPGKGVTKNSVFAYYEIIEKSVAEMQEWAAKLPSNSCQGQKIAA